jgi:hypothetical protein
MNSAFRLIMDTDAPLIAVHKARYFADKDEKLSLGPGGFVQGNGNVRMGDQAMTI